MKVAVFSARNYDRQFLEAADDEHRHRFAFVEARLTASSAPLATGHDAVCAFVNDQLDAGALECLAAVGVRLVLLRCTGVNNVDLAAAARLGLAVANVPAYSPDAVAEHVFALLLTLARKTHRAFNRVREGNFSLEGLIGSTLSGKTLGIVGVGAIGLAVARIGTGFGCRLLGADPRPQPEAEALGLRYRPFDELLARSDVVTLHCPLADDTRHLIDARSIARMKRGAILINTSRGAVVDTTAVIAALKNRHLGAVGIDVYEEEQALFFEDRSGEPILDDCFARLMTFPDVLITSHQGFFTTEAMTAIARAAIDNLTMFEEKGEPRYPVGNARRGDRADLAAATA